MPALMLDTWRPSECPTHGQVHAIWLDGHYGRWSAQRERVRYTCVRFDSSGARRTHRFVVPAIAGLPVESGSRAGETCRGCGLEQPSQPAPIVPEASTFAIPEIARLLIAVGEGRPLRDCAHDLRHAASRRHCSPNPGRARSRLDRQTGALPDVPLAELPAAPTRPPKPVPNGPPPPRDNYNYSAPKSLRRVDASRSASIAMDYVDQYGPEILRKVAPASWPVYVALGSVPIPRRKRLGLDEDPGLGGSGEIMVAADCELPGHGYAFHARFGGGSDKDSWIDFFKTLTGVPSWIVADRREGLSEAVAEFWPETILFNCENNMRAALSNAARRDGFVETLEKPGSPFAEIPRAFSSIPRWQDLVDAVESGSPAGAFHLRQWLDANEALVLSQFFLKKQFPRAPITDGSLDQAIADVREKLLPHAGTMRNLWRFNLRLALMSAHWSGLDRDADYAGVLTEHFSAVGKARARAKIARPDWSSGRDYGGSRSIEDFLAAAEARRLAARDITSRRRAAASPEHALVARNAARVAVGLPPIPPRVVREKVPAVALETDRAPMKSLGERIDRTPRRLEKQSPRRRRAQAPAARAAPAGPGHAGRAE